MSLAPLPQTPESRIRRYSELQSHDRTALHALLDDALLAHVGFVRDGMAEVIPMGFAREGESLLLHGSTRAGVLGGEQLTAAVTRLDGLVYAATLYDSTFNFRSAVIAGAATEVRDEAKIAALRVLSDRIMPGRWPHVPELTRQQLAAARVLRLPFDRVSLKIRVGAPDDADPGALWTGVVPLDECVGTPQPQPGTTAQIPSYVTALTAQRPSFTAP